MTNEAVIDLKANPTQLNDGLDQGLEDTKQFAEGATKALEKVNTASDGLTKHIMAVADEMQKLLDENSKITESTGEVEQAVQAETSAILTLIQTMKDQLIASAAITAASATYSNATTTGTVLNKAATTSYTALTASIVKNTASMAAGLMTTLKMNLATLAATLAIKGYALAAANTGKSLKVVDESLKGTQRMLELSGGDVKKLQKELDELGVTAEEAGIKFESNLSRIQDSITKLYDVTIRNATEGVVEESTSQWNLFFTKVGKAWDENVTDFTKGLTRITDGTTATVKTVREEWLKFLMTQQGYSKEIIEDELNRQKKYEETVKNSKVKAIQEKMYGEQLKAAEEYAMQRVRIAAYREEKERIAEQTSIDGATRNIEAHQKLQRELILTGRFKDETAKAWLEKDQDLYNAQQRLIQQAEQLRKTLVRETDARGADDRKKATEDIRRSNAIEIAGKGQLLAMLSDEEDELKRLAKLHVDDAAAYERNARGALLRVDVLRRAIRDRELKDIEEVNSKQEEAFNKQIAIKKTLRDGAKATDDVRATQQIDANIRALEKQGATLAQLHKVRMQNIDEEEKREKDKLEVKDPLAIAQIQVEAMKARAREIADYETKVSEDKYELEKVKLAEKNRKEDEELQKKGASEQQLSDRRVQRYREEALEATKLVATETAALQIKLELERKIREEEQRIKDLKKEGIDVNQTTGPQKQLTERQAFYAEAKQQKAARKAYSDARKLERKNAQQAKADARNKKMADAGAKKFMGKDQPKGPAAVKPRTVVVAGFHKKRQADLAKAVEALRSLELGGKKLGKIADEVLDDFKQKPDAKRTNRSNRHFDVDGMTLPTPEQIRARAEKAEAMNNTRNTAVGANAEQKRVANEQLMASNDSEKMKLMRFQTAYLQKLVDKQMDLQDAIKNIGKLN